ncbi:TPA: hypothetical protein ACG0LX_004980, partial [Enterobacter ludwigii]
CHRSERNHIGHLKFMVLKVLNINNDKVPYRQSYSFVNTCLGQENNLLALSPLMTQSGPT